MRVERLTKDKESYVDGLGALGSGDLLELTVWETTDSGGWELASATPGITLTSTQPLQAPLRSASNGTRDLGPGSRLRMIFDCLDDLDEWEVVLQWKSASGGGDRYVWFRSRES